MTSPASLSMIESERPGEMWADFSSALGPAAMCDCYGSEAMPPEARWGETVWAFHEDGLYKASCGLDCGRVAWSSVARYPKEPEHFELALGVWPGHQGRGLRARVLSFTADAAFLDLGADLITMIVFDSNSRHAVQCLRDSERGSAWVYSGRVWYPDPLRVFSLTREAWASSVSSK